jgi:hypothetical protein
MSKNHAISMKTLKNHEEIMKSCHTTQNHENHENHALYDPCFMSNFCQFLKKRQKLDLKIPMKCKKSKNLKIPSYKLQFIMDSVIKVKIWMSGPTTTEKSCKRIKIWVPILGIFLYKRPKTRENDPSLTRHISATRAS